MRELYQAVISISPTFTPERTLEFVPTQIPVRVPTGGYKLFVEFPTNDQYIVSALSIIDEVGVYVTTVVEAVMLDILNGNTDETKGLMLHLYDQLTIGIDAAKSVILHIEQFQMAVTRLTEYYLCRIPPMFISNPDLELIILVWNSPTTAIVFYC